MHLVLKLPGPRHWVPSYWPPVALLQLSQSQGRFLLLRGSGVAVGLSGSQTGVNYQLRIGGVNTGSPVAGTGSAISFSNQTAAGTYTVTATRAYAGCTANMTGSVAVTVNPLPTLYSVTGGGAYCSGRSGVAVGLSGSQSGATYQLRKRWCEYRFPGIGYRFCNKFW